MQSEQLEDLEHSLLSLNHRQAAGPKIEWIKNFLLTYVAFIGWSPFLHSSRGSDILPSFDRT